VRVTSSRSSVFFPPKSRPADVCIWRTAPAATVRKATASAGIDFSQGKFRRGTTDDELIRIIVRGIPAPMPPSGIADNQVATIVAYLRSMTAGNGDVGTGDPVRGRRHRRRQRRVSPYHHRRQRPARRTIAERHRHVPPHQRRPDALARQSPSAEVGRRDRTVRVVTKDGRTVSGRFLNQDTFSIQLIDATDKMLSIDKSTVRESTILATSPMPSFKDKLTPQELSDVVSYLATLKGRP
jgi:hypothetical protein